ncbi:MAG: Asp-tRNA(Asn)/Glu-tRNA(Gln) amidotransferase subunit GatA [Candidatus Andersenbacteria bacterium]
MSASVKTISELQSALQAGQTTAVTIVEATVTDITQRDPAIHAWLEVLAESALTAAHAYDQLSVEAKQQLPLGGIPVGIKDLILTDEGSTTAASHMLQRFKAPYMATVIARLKKAGAIIVGKTNLDEYAMGSSTEYSAFGVTKNPWDVSRVAGGSSGGSAAAVAAGFVPIALGTDTGGSIRQPASFCGVVGVKPTYGRVSRFGVIAYGSSLDQVGPFARTVADAARVLAVLAGHDSADATSSPETVEPYEEYCGKSIKGLRVGVPQEFFAEGVADTVRTIVEQAIDDLKALGAQIVPVSLPLTPTAIAVYYLLAKAEASSNLARYDALRFSPLDMTASTLLEHYREARGKGFGPEVKRAILMGTYTLSAGYYDAWYKQASKVRTLIIKEYQDVFQKVDVVAGPVVPETAFTIGSKADDPLAMYLSDALTVPLSVAGVPAISVPCGFAGGLPVGLQLAAPHWQEGRLFQVAHAYEQSHDWWKQSPENE